MPVINTYSTMTDDKLEEVNRALQERLQNLNAQLECEKSKNARLRGDLVELKKHNLIKLNSSHNESIEVGDLVSARDGYAIKSCEVYLRVYCDPIPIKTVSAEMLKLDSNCPQIKLRMEGKTKTHKLNDARIIKYKLCDILNDDSTVSGAFVDANNVLVLFTYGIDDIVDTDYRYNLIKPLTDSDKLIVYRDTRRNVLAALAGETLLMVINGELTLKTLPFTPRTVNYDPISGFIVTGFNPIGSSENSGAYWVSNIDTTSPLPWVIEQHIGRFCKLGEEWFLMRHNPEDIQVISHMTNCKNFSVDADNTLNCFYGDTQVIPEVLAIRPKVIGVVTSVGDEVTVDCSPIVRIFRDDEDETRTEFISTFLDAFGNPTALSVENRGFHMEQVAIIRYSHDQLVIVRS